MSLTTTFLIRGVGFDAGEVGMVNKTRPVRHHSRRPVRRRPDAAADAVSGTAHFRFAAGVSNAGYWLLSITDKHLYSMATAVFFENLCGEWGRRHLSRC